MKTSTLSTTALVLVASLFASVSLASIQTNAYVTFASSSTNTLNATYTPAADDYSEFSNGYLALDTSTNTITLASSAATAFTNAFNEGKASVFSASVAFTPATTTTEPAFGSSDMKFALYALENGSSTNLIVYGDIKYATTTTLTGAPVNLVVALTNDNNTTKFTVSVNDTLAQTSEGTTLFTAANNGTLSAVDLSGNGKINDIYFTNDKGFVAGRTVKIDNVDTQLTETQQRYLDTVVENGNNTHEDVLSALEKMSVNDFEKAQLLNTDLTKENAASATFVLSEVKRNGSKVSVTISLQRNNPLGAITNNATLHLLQSSDNSTFTTNNISLSGATFKDHTTETVEFELSDNNKFFKAEIGPKE